MPVLLAIYDAVVLASTLIPSACLRKSHPRASKAFLIAGSLAVSLWWLPLRLPYAV